MGNKNLLVGSFFVFLISCSNSNSNPDKNQSRTFYREELSKASEYCEKSYETCKVTPETQKANCVKFLKSLDRNHAKARSAYLLCAGQTCKFDANDEQFKKCLTISLAAHEISKHHGHRHGHKHRNRR